MHKTYKNMGKSKVLISIGITLAIFSLILVSASFGYNNRDLIIQRTLNDSLDPRWSGNYSNLITSDCGAGYLVIGMYENGSFKCAEDTGTGSLAEYIKWADVWDQIYNETEVDAINTSMENFVINTNATMKDYVDAVAGVDLSAYVSYTQLWLQVYNETEIDAQNSTMNTHILNVNTTMKDYVDAVGGGPESDPYWTANYSAYNTTWSTDTVDTTWLANWTAYNTSWSSGSETNWNANYSTFLTVSAWNDTGLIRDWNDTGWIINWNESGLIRDWTSATETDPFWTGNYSAYNDSWTTTDSEIWTIASNGTLFLTSDYNASGLILDWNDSGLIQDWNASGLIINWSDSGFTESDPYWLANYSNFLTISAWNDSGLIRDWNDTGLIRDWTSSSEVDPYWTANYSAYNDSWTTTDSEIWTIASNGTLFLTSSYNASGLILDWNDSGLIQDWNASGLIREWASASETDPYWTGNQSSYVTYTQLWSQVYNETEIDAQNSTMNTHILNVNTTMKDYVDAVSSPDLSPYVTYTQLWLQVYNESEIDTQNSTMNTHILNVNATMKDYVDATGGGPETDPYWTANYSAYNDSWSAGGSGSLTGAGTVNYIPMWNDTHSLNNSIIYQNGTRIGIGIIPTSYSLEVSGTAYFSNTIDVNNGLYAGGSLSTGSDIYTLGSGDDFWLGDSTQTSANLQAYANGSLFAVDSTFQNNVTATYFVGDATFLTNVPAGTETDPYWTGNQSSYVSYTQLWLQVYNETEIDAQNTTMNTHILNVNSTMKDYVDAVGGTSDATWVANWTAYNSSAWTTTDSEIWNVVYNQTFALIDEPLWTANQTNMLTSCPTGNYTYGIYDNGTWLCRDDDTGASSEAVTAIGGGTINYTAYFNDTYNLNPSPIYVDGTDICIGCSSASSKLEVSGNVTATYFLGDATFLTNVPAGTESDPFWTGNYSAYNTTWSTDTVDTTWLANWTAYNSTWSSGGGVLDGAGTTYYIPMWNDTHSLNNSVIYLNGDELTIGSTIQVNFNIKNNGNIASGGDIYTTGSGDDIWLGASTPASASFRALSNGSLITVDGLFDNNVTATYFVGDATFLTNVPAGTESDPYWTGNQSSYVTYTQLWSQVYNETEIDAQNTTMNTHILNVNTTMKDYVDAVASPDLDPYVTYTQLWLQVYNETEIDNFFVDYVTYTQLWLQVYNETEIDAQNSTMNTHITNVNATMKDYVNSEDTRFNDTMKAYVDATGGSSDATWVANWTAYNSTQWTTTDSEIWGVCSNSTFANIDEPLWTANWTAYNLTWTTTDAEIWSVAGNGTLADTTQEETFTGNITVEGIKLEADTTNHYISDNSTCVIISGDTSDLRIC